MNKHPLLKEIDGLTINGWENIYQQLAEAVLLDQIVVNSIVDLAARKYGVDPKEIIKKPYRNCYDTLNARYWLAFLLREHGLTFNTIGRILGGVHFTTALYCYGKGKELLH